MTTFCLTFGQRYFDEPHPSGIPVTPNGWVEIEAADIDEARKMAFETFGEWWSFMRERENFDETYFPVGCFMRILELRHD